ncbi:DNA-binding MarR family transcriptional regulator [Rhodobacter viridis]|uniref:DNA-binding MarR family transcriptional regulator n=1 Tax=Rhodobacter viridis TaxID=1054202 RepID=A0A318U2D6_9RHOB|nr:MarR family transcriptional regulator [Rhodobacter viridis]PYF10328.1 DNA-binding MarR family transcriptional regulator [Rhodobacter viridis]
MAAEDDVRANMRRLFRIVEEIRDQYPRMELGQVAVLLSVLSDPGMRATDLRSRVGLQKSALSRNVRALSQTSYLQDEDGGQRQGLNLIVQAIDPFDSRAHLLNPTKKGKALAKKLSDMLG